MTLAERQQWLDERIDPEDQRKVNVLPSRMMPAYTMSPEKAEIIKKKEEEAALSDGTEPEFRIVEVTKSLYI